MRHKKNTYWINTAHTFCLNTFWFNTDTFLLVVLLACRVFWMCTNKIVCVILLQQLSRSHMHAHAHSRAHIRTHTHIRSHTNAHAHTPLIRKVFGAGEAARVILVLAAVFLPRCYVAETVRVDIYTFLVYIYIRTHTYIHAEDGKLEIT